MKWITCKTEYYSWLVEVLNTKKIEQLSQNTTMFVYSKAFNIASASALKLAWPIGEDGHNFQGWLNTLMCTISRRCVWLPKRTFFGPDLTRVNYAGSSCMFFPKWPGIKSDWGWVCNLRTVRSQILFARSSGINSQTSAPCFVLPLPALSSNWSWSITKKRTCAL